MAEETKETKETKEDPTKNLKSEMDRKFANVLEQLKATTDSLSAQIQGIAPKKDAAPPKTGNFSERFYKDEEGTIQEVVTNAKKEMMDEIALSNRQHHVLNTLFQDFPELADAHHELTKKANEIHRALPDWEKKAPSSYRMAALEAANALDIVPFSKRTKEGDDDGFTMGRGNTKGKERKPKEGEVSDGTIDFARRMGLNVDDEKVMDRLKKSAKRNWTKYQQPGN